MKFLLTDKNGWFDLLTTGEVRNTGRRPDGETVHVVQIFTPEVLANLMEVYNQAGKPELLIDREHRSNTDDGDTTAMGWLIDLRMKGPGLLQGKARWTSTGLTLLEGGELRYCSATVDTKPLPDPNGTGKTPKDPRRMEPINILRVGLTNLPAVNVRSGADQDLLPISNRDGWPDSAPLSPDHSTPPANPPIPTPKPKPKMNKIALLLGLSETATEEEITKAIEALVAGKKTAETAAADTIIAANKAKIPAGQEDFLRNLLISNRAGALEFLASMPDLTPAPAKENPAPGFDGVRVHNKAAATPPGTPPGLKDDPKPDPAELKEKQDSEILTIMNRDKCSRSRAFETARAAKPDLFKY